MPLLGHAVNVVVVVAGLAPQQLRTVKQSLAHLLRVGLLPGFNEPGRRKESCNFIVVVKLVESRLRVTLELGRLAVASLEETLPDLEHALLLIRKFEPVLDR